MLRTSRQKRNLCRECPVARVADIVGDTVSILILRDLIVSPRQFTDFGRAYEGVSSRTVAQKLRILEEAGFIARTPDKKNYPRVDYRVTHKGAAFADVIDTMRRFGKRYL